MIEIDNLKVKGTVQIWNKDKTKLLNEYENAFLHSGQTAFMNFLKGGFYIDGYRYLGIGVGGNATDLDMETLEDEKFRKEFSNVQVDGTKLILDTMIEAEEANLDEPWQELGLYMGGTAGIENSGVLFNRVRVLEKKDHRSAITVSWVIEVITS